MQRIYLMKNALSSQEFEEIARKRQLRSTSRVEVADIWRWDRRFSIRSSTLSTHPLSNLATSTIQRSHSWQSLQVFSETKMPEEGEAVTSVEEEAPQGEGETSVEEAPPVKVVKAGKAGKAVGKAKKEKKPVKAKTLPNHPK